MTSSDPSDPVPTLTSQDIVKLLAVLYLPLCEALEARQLIKEDDLATRILALSVPDAPAPWAQVAVAMATVLKRPADAAVHTTDGGKAKLSCIIGGKAG